MTREYFNNMAPTWDETIAEKDKAKLELLARNLDIMAGSTVLDVGTGTGVFIPYLLARIGHSGRLVALDFAEEMLKQAQAKNFDGKIEYILSDISSVPLLNETFDAVVCYSSFPHFRNRTIALREMYRLLKKLGKLFICHSSSREVINRIHRQITVLAHDTIPDNDEMRTLISAAGFAHISISETSWTYLVKAKKAIGPYNMIVPPST